MRWSIREIYIQVGPLEKHRTLLIIRRYKRIWRIIHSILKGTKGFDLCSLYKGKFRIHSRVCAIYCGLLYTWTSNVARGTIASLFSRTWSHIICKTVTNRLLARALVRNLSMNDLLWREYYMVLFSSIASVTLQCVFVERDVFTEVWPW